MDFITLVQTAPPAVEERLAIAAPTLASMPHVTLVGYPVEGRNRRAVRTAMNQSRPDHNGTRHDAKTEWRFLTRWSGGSNGTCLPQTAEVTYAITITMPDLVDSGRLNRADEEAWHRYFAALESHEANHARIGAIGAAQMQAAMRAATDCESMTAATAAVQEEVRAANLEYDRITEHGRREGATF